MHNHAGNSQLTVSAESTKLSRYYSHRRTTIATTTTTCNYIQRALLTNNTTSKLQVQQLSMRSKHLCAQNHKMGRQWRKIERAGGRGWGEVGRRRNHNDFLPATSGWRGTSPTFNHDDPPIKSPSPLSRCHVASSDKCIEGSVAPPMRKAPSLGWGALPLLGDWRWHGELPRWFQINGYLASMWSWVGEINYR
jgi:hypothetical protein